MDLADKDLSRVTTALAGSLGDVLGRLRATDAHRLAGFDQRTPRVARLVGEAMRALGWERERCRFDGVITYAFVRGSYLEREAVIDVDRGEGDVLVVRRRAPGSQSEQVARREP